MSRRQAFIGILRVVPARNGGRLARLIAGGWSMPCAIGAAGFGQRKREGDHKTPLGTWPLRMLYYRPDRMTRPVTALPVQALRADDGWCDAPRSPHYNRRVPMPFAASAETLWREDHLYDLIVPLGINDDPVCAARGSAIFLHVARADYGPTEGCVAIAERDLLRLLPRLNTGTLMVIG